MIPFQSAISTPDRVWHFFSSKAKEKIVNFSPITRVFYEMVINDKEYRNKFLKTSVNAILLLGGTAFCDVISRSLGYPGKNISSYALIFTGMTCTAVTSAIYEGPNFSTRYRKAALAFGQVSVMNQFNAINGSSGLPALPSDIADIVIGYVGTQKELYDNRPTYRDSLLDYPMEECVRLDIECQWERDLKKVRNNLTYFVMLSFVPLPYHLSSIAHNNYPKLMDSPWESSFLLTSTFIGTVGLRLLNNVNTKYAKAAGGAIACYLLSNQDQVLALGKALLSPILASIDICPPSSIVEIMAWSLYDKMMQ